MTSGQQRLDLELVARGLAPSRTTAKGDIEAGLVAVDGTTVHKPATKVGDANAIVLSRREPAYVGRAGHKLDAALDAFSVDPTGATCVDAGASTGGFTDCLLLHGASSVVAVDVGTDQLHPRIRADERVIVREQTDIRTVRASDLGGPVDLVVADVSFISLRAVLPTLGTLVRGRGDLLVLVKPQFEAGRESVAAGRGVIRQASIWRRVLTEVAAAAAALGLSLRGATVSPITGASGNVEFMVWFQPAEPSLVTHADDEAVDDAAGSRAMIDAVVADAESRSS